MKEFRSAGFTAEASLYRGSATYRWAHGTFTSDRSGVVIPQFDWCGLKCQGKYLACGLGCASMGPLAGPCAAFCFYGASKCLDACLGEGGLGTGGSRTGAPGGPSTRQQVF